MRAIAIAFAAMAATVSAKISWGPCDYANIVQWAWSDYDDLTKLPDTGYYHDIVGMDTDMQDEIESLYAFGFKPPFDYQCDDLGEITPFLEIAKALFDEAEKADSTQTDFDEVNFYYQDQDAFESVFAPSTNAFHRLVWVDETTKTMAAGYVEYHYLCGDTTDFGPFLEFAGLRGADPSYTLSNTLTSLFGIFNKLGLALRFHGIFMTADYDNFDYTDLEYTFKYPDQDYMPQYIAGYNIHEITYIAQDQLDCAA